MGKRDTGNERLQFGIISSGLGLISMPHWQSEGSSLQAATAGPHDMCNCMQLMMTITRVLPGAPSSSCAFASITLAASGNEATHIHISDGCRHSSATDLSMHSVSGVSRIRITFDISASSSATDWHRELHLHAHCTMQVVGFAIARHTDSSKAPASCCGRDKSHCLSIAFGQSQMHPMLLPLPLAAAIQLQAGS